MAGHEKGKAGEMAGKAGEFLGKLGSFYEAQRYFTEPVIGGIYWWIHKSFAKGAFAKGFLGGALAALGLTFVKEFITGGGGH